MVFWNFALNKTDDLKATWEQFYILQCYHILKSLKALFNANNVIIGKHDQMK